MAEERTRRWWPGVSIALERAVALGFAASVIIIGCAEPQRQALQAPRPAPPASPAAQPDLDPERGAPPREPAQQTTDPQTAAPPAVPEADFSAGSLVLDPFRAEVRIENLTQPQLAWLRIIEQSRKGEPSSASGRYLEHNEFVIDSVNIDAFTLDRGSLPVEKSKRLVMHIDGQNLVVYPREQGALAFRRSAAGSWEYVPP